MGFFVACLVRDPPPLLLASSPPASRAQATSSARRSRVTSSPSPAAGCRLESNASLEGTRAVLQRGGACLLQEEELEEADAVGRGAGGGLGLARRTGHRAKRARA